MRVLQGGTGFSKITGMMRWIPPFAAMAAMGLALATPLAAGAQEMTALGTFGKWVAYTYTDKGKPVCYMAAKPDKSEGSYKARGEVQLLVTHRPAEKAFDVLSVVAGYQYKPDSDVTLAAGGQTFTLFTNADRAWARDSKTDSAVVQQLIKSSTAVIKGTSSRNTPTTDTVSLTGFSAAYKAIGDTCKKP
ncbi:MAG: invasion associated locus B family protein [Rhodospirillaceae bacterium]|nr:invasion associated locus B family protein [Rhodospirillaceae bacterium]